LPLFCKQERKSDRTIDKLAQKCLNYILSSLAMLNEL
jgi:hypothetical protein